MRRFRRKLLDLGASSATPRTKRWQRAFTPQAKAPDVERSSPWAEQVLRKASSRVGGLEGKLSATASTRASSRRERVRIVIRGSPRRWRPSASSLRARCSSADACSTLAPPSDRSCARPRRSASKRSTGLDASPTRRSPGSTGPDGIRRVSARRGQLSADARPVEQPAPRRGPRALPHARVLQKSVIETHVGPRLVAQAQQNGVRAIDKAIGYFLPTDPAKHRQTRRSVPAPRGLAEDVALRGRRAELHATRRAMGRRLRAPAALHGRCQAHPPSALRRRGGDPGTGSNIGDPAFMATRTSGRSRASKRSSSSRRSTARGISPSARTSSSPRGSRSSK